MELDKTESIAVSHGLEMSPITKVIRVIPNSQEKKYRWQLQ